MKKNVLIVTMALFLSSCANGGACSECECSESRVSSESSSSVSTYEQGYDEGHSAGYQEGYSSGYQEGYSSGYQEGYEDGKDDASYNPGKGLLIHTGIQEEYLNGDPYLISSYANGGSEICQPDCIHLDYQDCYFPTGAAIKVYVSENEDLSDGGVYETESLEGYDLYNCKLGTQYYWRASATKDGTTYLSPLNTFTTQGGILRNIKAGNLSNTRDLGYYEGIDGKRIRQGLIYRSASFSFAGTLSEEGKDVVLNQLGIKTDLDLAYCGHQVSELSYVSAPMKWSASDLNGKTIIDADCNLASIGKCFETFANPSSYPLTFHCTRGRDRTGAIAFLLESLLGVSTRNMTYDYLFTAFSENNAVSDSTLIDQYLNVVNAYSGATQAEKTENFLENAVGVSSENIQSIKAILLA